MIVIILQSWRQQKPWCCGWNHGCNPFSKPLLSCNFCVCICLIDVGEVRRVRRAVSGRCCKRIWAHQAPLFSKKVGITILPCLIINKFIGGQKSCSLRSHQAMNSRGVSPWTKHSSVLNTALGTALSQAKVCLVLFRWIMWVTLLQYCKDFWDMRTITNNPTKVVVLPLRIVPWIFLTRQQPMD